MARPLVGAMIAVLGFGCGRQLNPKYCADHPEDGDCRDAGLVSFDAPPPQCNSNLDCVANAGKPACDVSSHTCVACLPNAVPSTCPGTQVCGDDLMCHGCVVDTNCMESRVCTPAGTCADEMHVLYASPPGGGDCLTHLAPCTLPIAVSKLSAQRYILKLTTLAGTDYSTPPITIDATGQAQGYLVLGTGTTLTPQGDGDGIATSGNVEIVGIRIQNATGSNSEGVECTNGILTLRRMTLANNAGYGVRTMGCDVTFERTTMSGNPLGALLVDTATIEIRNNFLVQNGTGNLAQGNVQLKNVTGRFVFNTVASNQSKNGNNTSGISCTKMSAGVVVSRNIFADNGGANNVSSGDCAVSPTTNYVSNSTTEIMFAPGDYHLTAASLPNMVLDDPLADADCKLAGNYIDDIDGQPRPVDFCDRGADEYRP